MKKLISILILLLSSLSSCNTEEEFNNETVIGTWRTIENSGWKLNQGKKEYWHHSLDDIEFDNFQITFFLDGTGVYNEVSKFYWEIDKNLLYIKDGRESGFGISRLIIKNKNTCILITKKKDCYHKTTFKKLN